MPRPSERVTFTGSLGTELAGRLDLPAGPARAFALFAHCFTCSKDLVASGRIADELTVAGFAVLRFDFTGLGSSEGDFANTDFSSNLHDLRLAAEWLRTNHAAPQLLVGHSLGGAAVVSVAPEIPEVQAVVTIGAPADVDHVADLFVDRIDEIRREGTATVDVGGRPFTIRKEFLDDLRSHSVADRARTLDAALLVLHSPIDQTVGIENAAAIYEAARHPKSFVTLDGADHLLLDRVDAAYVGRTIATWADRYVEDARPLSPPPAFTTRVGVAETGIGTFLSHVVIGDHGFLADEPVSAGGFDAGPSPFDLLCAALGACTSMTLRMYAERKALPLDRVSVEVTHRKIPVGDLPDHVPDEGATEVDVFDRRIRLEGDLDDDQRASLLRIAERCPVHRTLERRARIITKPHAVPEAATTESPRPTT